MNEQNLKDMYNGIKETLNKNDANWEKELKGISQSRIKFEELDDNDIFEGLSWAIMSAQAKWKTIEKHETTIKNILLGFKINQIANLSDDDVNEIYRQLRSLDSPKIASRLLKTHLLYIRNNARKLICLFPDSGSFKTFIAQDFTRIKDLMKSPQYKMDGVGDVIFNEFAKNIGIPSVLYLK